MKTIISTLLIVMLVGLAGIAQQQSAGSPQSSLETAPQIPYRIVGTMSQLMVDIIYPTSDDILYIVTRPPSNDAQWAAIQRSALTLAESANLLMMPGRARDQDKWMTDAKLMLAAGMAAYAAAKKQDVAALVAL